ncbi:MAG: sensor histidine kinase [Chloroflexi bacterium]|nr:MAG: sensor histidine kinase [Chloroflexota bacterium]
MIEARPGSWIKQLKLIQWLLPLGLFLLASTYESVEHILRGQEGMTFNFNAEVLIFGIIGPVIVGLVLHWIRGQLVKLEEANRQIQALNSELEQRVAERTAELAQKNEALEKANEELKALDTLKSDFVSLVSHELRAPLTNINGGIELIAAERSHLSSARQEVLDILQRESKRLTRLVQNILDISLLEAGRLTNRPGFLPLRPFLCQLLKGRVPANGKHRLVIDVQTDLPPAWADETHLGDVVVNLVDNAIKYSPEGGEIRVAARPYNEHELVISVSDQGIGIPPSAQPRLFERFYRANNGTDREVYGHGLGLYFCRKLIEAQGGRIWVESSGIPGQGATFYFTVPACCEGVPNGADFAD